MFDELSTLFVSECRFGTRMAGCSGIESHLGVPRR